MLLNMVAHAWIIGSITLLIVKQDEKTGAYREAIQTLRQYSNLHDFPRPLEKKLRGQLQLDFNNSEISDEHVLGNFPTETRRKVLRRLYLPSLMQTNLMRGIRQQFVDSFLTTCKVEIFSAGDEILQRGAISSDLYLLVGGCAELIPSLETSAVPIEHPMTRVLDSQYGGTSIGDSSRRGKIIQVASGEFINAISFFTESPQMETVRTKTVCKTLTLPRTVYKMIAEDHPGSIGKLLQNLLENVEELARKTGEVEKVNLPTRLSVLRAGSIYETIGEDGSTSEDADFQNTVDAIQTSASLTAVRDLVKMHLNKMKDDHTTRFLFAASRGDTDTIALMCDQGFDPNSADYDQRTALMVAAMKGNAETVQTILDYNANPNLVDMHGSSALYEAARNGHDESMRILVNHGAKLAMTGAAAASRACQAVFDGDMLTLRRLLNAGLPVNAGDYDKRRAVHIAAAEGNVAALKIMVEFGADLTVKDRWGNTVDDEAKSVGASQVLTFLKNLQDGANED
jgi:CRP-like cAMP-binding protein